jgi:ElaB/YqjD/DUF883 family membrane-anchored ribosome-binding protein
MSSRRRSRDSRKEAQFREVLEKKEPQEGDILHCPITKELLRDPVVVEGVSHFYAFERTALMRLIKINGGKFRDPLTRQVIGKPVIKDAKDHAELIKHFEKLKKETDANSDALQVDIEDYLSAIDKLEENGAHEIAEVLRERLRTFRQFMSPSRLAVLAAGVCAVTGAATASALSAPGTTVALSATAGGSVGSVAGSLFYDDFDEMLDGFDKKLARANKKHTEELKKEFRGKKTVAEMSVVRSRAVQVKRSAAIGVAALQRMEVATVSTAKKWCVGVGATIGLIAGGYLGYTAAAAVLAEGAAAVEGATAIGSMAVSMGAGGTAVVCGLTGAAAAAVLGYCVWRMFFMAEAKHKKD